MMSAIHSSKIILHCIMGKTNQLILCVLPDKGLNDAGPDIHPAASDCRKAHNSASQSRKTVTVEKNRKLFSKFKTAGFFMNLPIIIVFRQSIFERSSHRSRVAASTEHPFSPHIALCNARSRYRSLPDMHHDRRLLSTFPQQSQRC